MDTPVATLGSVQALLAAAIPSRPPFGFAWLATADGAGIARVRTMTLRGYDPNAGTLWTTCHINSQKVQHLRHKPVAEICLWLGEAGVQLRVQCNWRVVDSATPDVALQALRLDSWNQQPAQAQALYEPPPPGHAPQAFALLLGTIDIIDALFISPTAHAHYRHQRRANGWHSEKLAR